jgi:hypothetical protein
MWHKIDSIIFLLKGNKYRDLYYNEEGLNCLEV